MCLELITLIPLLPVIRYLLRCEVCPQVPPLPTVVVAAGGGGECCVSRCILLRRARDGICLHAEITPCVTAISETPCRHFCGSCQLVVARGASDVPWE